MCNVNVFDVESCLFLVMSIDNIDILDGCQTKII